MRGFIGVILTLLSALLSTCGAQVAPQSSPQPFAELQRAAEAGDAEAQFRLGRAYEDGDGAPKNDDLAAKWYRKATDKGSAAAQTSLGVLYLTGRGVDKNKEEAVRWYRKAAKQGYASAYFNLGAAYYNGDGVPYQRVSACTWFLLAEHYGSDPGKDAFARTRDELGANYVAQPYYFAALMLQKGQEVPQDLPQAVTWMREAANRDLAVAQWRLGEFYGKGIGLPKDPNEAASWRQRALAADHSGGLMMEMGDLYRNGQEVPQDDKLALQWYESAASLGQWIGMLNAAEMYAQGIGTVRDITKAYLYVVAASIRHRQGSGDILKSLEQHMSAEEIKKARAEARKKFRGVVFYDEEQKAKK